MLTAHIVHWSFVIIRASRMSTVRLSRNGQETHLAAYNKRRDQRDNDDDDDDDEDDGS